MAFVVSYLLNTKKVKNLFLFFEDMFFDICKLLLCNDHEVSSSPAGYAGRYWLRVLPC